LMISRKLLVTFIALGFVSLFADITYEGARSVGGAYLNVLAAPAVAAGILGFGEVLSYLMRLVGGAAAQRASTGKVYWGLVFAGYATNLAIPLLALAGSWPLALALFFVERLGKGLRAPARDVILAEVTEGIGRGKGFGIHELMDQIGAVVGPAIVGVSIALHGAELQAGYTAAFLLLALPAALALAFLAVAYSRYPEPKAVQARAEGRGPLGKIFGIYLAGSTAMAFGFLYWGVFSYHAQEIVRLGTLTAGEVPILYLVAMGVDAAVALPIGLLYDRVGVKSILIAPLAALPLTPVLFYGGGRLGLYSAAILWGLVMGIAETMMRAAVADIVPPASRAMAYGIYASAFGAAWFVGGGMITSYLYQVGSLNGIVAVSIAAEAVALTIYAFLLTATGKATSNNSDQAR